MPLPNIADRRAYHYDNLLDLRPFTEAAITVTTAGTGVEFAVKDIDVEKVVVHTAAITGVDASNYWIIAVEVSDTQAGTYTEIARGINLPATAGYSEIAISGAAAEAALADAAWIRINAIRTGTAGGLTYGAFVSPG